MAHPTRWYSSRQETQVAKAVGGKTTCNSGAYRFTGGDLTIGDDWLLECKTCTKPQKSFTLQKEWFIKNRQESISLGRPYTALVFDFGDGEQHYVINERLFKQLIKYLKGEEDNEN